MNKLRWLLFVCLLLLSQATGVSAQTWNYEGTYLTSDENQWIHGFHFDSEKEQIIVLTQQSSAQNWDQMQNQERFINIVDFGYSNFNFEQMTAEEMEKFNENYDVDYAEALSIAAESAENNENTHHYGWDNLFLVQLPGIHSLIPRYQRYAPNSNTQIIVINQANLTLRSNLWEVTVLDEPTQILRFEASTNNDQLTDDFGIIYEKQTTPYEFPF